MAILVMSVGLLSVMTLFPIAYLRSVQGTQLTNGAILKMRAESIVDMFQLVGDTYIPQPREGQTTHCLIDPLGWQDVNRVSGQARAQQYGIDAAANPAQYNLGAQTQFINVVGGVSADRPVRPLRRLSFSPVPPITIGPNGAAPYSSAYLFGFTGHFTNRGTALSAVALPDTFETQLTAIASSNTASEVIFNFADQLVDADDMTYLNGLLGAGVPLRLTLFDKATGKRSLTRLASAVAANATSGTISWLAAQPIPVDTIGEVRVQTADPRYSWMLTVRKKGLSGGSVSEVDCVVFFNRATEDPEEELVHQALIPTDDPLISPDDRPYSGVVTFSAYASGQTAPLKRGGWVFDPTHARWYRVQSILFEDAARAVIRLDRRPEHDITTLVIPRGVIQVFPMKPRVDQGQRLQNF